MTIADMVAMSRGGNVPPMVTGNDRQHQVANADKIN